MIHPTRRNRYNSWVLGTISPNDILWKRMIERDEDNGVAATRSKIFAAMVMEEVVQSEMEV